MFDRVVNMSFEKALISENDAPKILHLRKRFFLGNSRFLYYISQWILPTVMESPVIALHRVVKIRFSSLSNGEIESSGCFKTSSLFLIGIMFTSEIYVRCETKSIYQAISSLKE